MTNNWDNEKVLKIVVMDVCQCEYNCCHRIVRLT